MYREMDGWIDRIDSIGLDWICCDMYDKIDRDRDRYRDRNRDRDR
jgi:hypothetical protein